MKPEEQALIRRCRELADELAANEPPAWSPWEHGDWAEQMEHGPRYMIGRWFGPQRERERMRYRRAIDNLEASGLVVTHRSCGSRLTHVALSDAGRVLSDTLRHATPEPTTDG